MNFSIPCLILSVVLASSSFASSRVPVAKGEATVFNAARSFEVSIEGKAAQKLYDAMRSSTRMNGNWTLKYGNGLTCGKSARGEFACSFNVDQDGLIP